MLNEEKALHALSATASLPKPESMTLLLKYADFPIEINDLAHISDSPNSEHEHDRHYYQKTAQRLQLPRRSGFYQQMPQARQRQRPD